MVVTHVFNLSIQEEEAYGFWIQGQLGLWSELQDTQGCTEKPIS